MSFLSLFGKSHGTSHGSGGRSFFKGGVHPDEHKDTASLPIEEIPPPKKVQIHLSQSIGEPANALVKRGDVVKRGQVIGEAVGNGVPVHASISGKVSIVTKANHPSQLEGNVVVVEADPSVAAEEFPEDSEWKVTGQVEMLRRIHQAGIVGLGGAAFPTYRKLTLPSTAKVDTLVLNGAECEPYLTSDHRVMLEYPEEIIQGAWLMARIVGVSRCLIGIEDNKVDAANKLSETIARLKPEAFDPPVKFEVHVVHTRYPQGSEKQLIQALTGRNIPARKLPMDVGVVVQNVATAVAVHDAVRFKKPLMDRIVTVSGKGIAQPKNIRVPIGTSLDELAQACGGMKEETVKIIAGGPMMGRTLPTLDVPVVKGLGGLLFLTREETYLGDYQPCIQCGECLDVCPLGLEPNRISVLTESGLPLRTAEYGTMECFECGCCSYACPSKRPLVQFIQVAKTAYRRDQARVKEATHGK